MACPWETAIQLSVSLSIEEECVDYLTTLTELLQGCVNDTPTLPVPFLPPSAVGGQNRNSNQSNSHRNRANQRTNANNRFQMDSDEEDVVEAEEKLANLQIQPLTGTSRWSAEDVFIQVVTTLGEILGKLSVLFAKEHKWTQSAEQITRSVALLNLALQYADMMYARITARAELGDRELEVITDRVRRNCEAVGIAAGHGNDKKAQFEQEAVTRRRQLEAKLSPQLRDRDEAKQKMGEEAWTRNPNPKGDYARRRMADEKELRELNAAMESVGAADFSTVRERSEQLRNVA